jgi:methionyl aminopeptidase
MRRAGRLAAEILDALVPHVVPGVSTQELDDIVHKMTLDAGAVPATLGYRGYTKSCCISINHVVCHGIPSDRTIRDGDIVNIDVTPIVDGWHGDTSRMYNVGEPSVLAKRLCTTAYEAMLKGIEQVRPGATLGDIGHAIQEHVEAQRFSVVREYCGHGIGTIYHEDPQVLHYGHRGVGLRLQKGMTFTIEPMVNAGKPQTRLLPDGWTVVTRDHSLSAQWEHTIAVTDTGFEILTPWPKAA